MNLRNFCLMLLFQILFLPLASANNDLTVQMKTTPAASEISPIHNMPEGRLAHVTLTVVDKDGRVVPNSFIKVHIHAPKKHLISTDFPWVEDTHLIEYVGALPTGVMEFDYGFPIRGTYRFDLQAGRDVNALSDKVSTMLSISENKIVRKNLYILIAILFVIGLISGVVIGRGARAQKIAVGLSMILFLCLSLTTKMSSADGGDHHHMMMTTNNVPAIEETASGSQMVLNFKMNPGEGRVGMQNEMNFSVKDKNGRLIPNTTYELKLWHMEEDTPVFVGSFYSPDGALNFKYQFTDGAPHEVRLTARNTLGTIELKKSFEVQRMHPPFAIRFRTEILLLLIVLVGIVLGLKTQSYRPKTA